MSATERRERLIRYLCMNGITTSKELARELEVSERTILRDVSLLSRNKPITTIAGKEGGIYITDYKRIHLLYLKDEEIILLEKIHSNLDLSIREILSPDEISLLYNMISLYKSPKKTDAQYSL